MADFNSFWSEDYAQHRFWFGGGQTADRGTQKKKGETTTRKYATTVYCRTVLEQTIQHVGMKQGADVPFSGREPRCRDGQETGEMACSRYADAVGFLDEADEIGHALETLRDTAAQYWQSWNAKDDLS